MLFCHERQGEQPGFVHLGVAKGDNGFHLYRRQDDPIVAQREEEWKARQGNSHAGNGSIDWTHLAANYRAALTPEPRDDLAALLGLPPAVLDSLSTGWNEQASCWTFPEVDAEGHVIGIGQRRRDNSKNQVTGGRRGLYVPRGWMDRGGPLLLPEGASNTLALTAMGLSAIGRPSNLAGVDHLAKLLATFPADREIIVIGDFDPKPNGKWPGLEGCKSIAAQLSQRLKRRVCWVLPPEGSKDVRVWTNNQKLPLDCADSWHEAGETLLANLQERCKEAGTQEGNTATNAPNAEDDFGWRFEAIDSKTFFGTDYSLEWLVQRVLVALQPAVFGGPLKSLKTSQLIDLAVSLATGTPFLGRFEVHKPRRVVFISGESGEAVLQECGRRVCDARDINPATLDIAWSFRLPQLGRSLDRQRLCEGLREIQAEVAIIEPLYLCLLAGADRGEVEAGNFYQMGPLLSQVNRACLDSGCTPILGHHALKHTSQKRDPLELDDLSFAGIAEFARQWILVNRREPFDPNTGSSKLWLSVGGSAGQSGCWAVDIEEGVIQEDFSGRKWEVTVQSMSDRKQLALQQGEAKRREDLARRNREDDDRFMAALDEIDPQGNGVTFTAVRNAAGLSSDKANGALHRLVQGGIVRRILDLEVTVGKGAKRRVLGVRRVKDDRP